VLPNESLSFLTLLPMTLHFWAASVAIYSWLRVFWSTSLKRTTLEIERFRKQIASANVVFGVGVTAIAGFISFADEGTSMTWLVRIGGFALALINAVVALVVLLSSQMLLNHVVRAAQLVELPYNAVVVFKLRVTGIVCAICFSLFSTVTLISVVAKALYLRYDVWLNLIVKMSDFIGFIAVMYMFEGTAGGVNRRGSTTALSRASKRGSATAVSGTSRRVSMPKRTRLSVLNKSTSVKAKLANTRGLIEEQDTEDPVNEELGEVEPIIPRVKPEQTQNTAEQTQLKLQQLVSTTGTEQSLNEESQPLNIEAQTTPAQLNECYQCGLHGTGKCDETDDMFYCRCCWAEFDVESQVDPEVTAPEGIVVELQTTRNDSKTNSSAWNAHETKKIPVVGRDENKSSDLKHLNVEIRENEKHQLHTQETSAVPSGTTEASKRARQDQYKSSKILHLQGPKKQNVSSNTPSLAEEQ